MAALAALAAIPVAAATVSGVAQDLHSKARAVAQEFESVFLSAMLQPMVSAANDGGPFGGSAATGVWRSMLTDEYAKSFSAAGGIGIADHVYRSLIAAQENAS